MKSYDALSVVNNTPPECLAYVKMHGFDIMLGQCSEWRRNLCYCLAFLCGLHLSIELLTHFRIYAWTSQCCEISNSSSDRSIRYRSPASATQRYIISQTKSFHPCAFQSAFPPWVYVKHEEVNTHWQRKLKHSGLLRVLNCAKSTSAPSRTRSCGSALSLRTLRYQVQQYCQHTKMLAPSACNPT